MLHAHANSLPIMLAPYDKYTITESVCLVNYGISKLLTKHYVPERYV